MVSPAKSSIQKHGDSLKLKLSSAGLYRIDSLSIGTHFALVWFWEAVCVNSYLEDKVATCQALDISRPVTFFVL
jgi:hypothetical protein